MRILVVGAGAIGGVTGGRLTHAGADATLVDRVEPHVRAMQTDGLLIDGYAGELRVPVSAVTPDELQGAFDVVLLAVKSQHTMSALELIDGHLSASGFVVSVQNGLGNKPLLARTLGAERALGAMVRLTSGYQGPGHVRQINQGRFAVGELDGRMSERLDALRQLLDQVAPTVATPNIFGWLWAKETYGVMLKVTVVVGDTVGEVLALPGAAELVVQAMRECAAVARAEGVSLEAFDFLDPNALLGGRPEDHARVEQDLNAMRARFGEIKSGTWRDIAVRHIPTEVPYALGEVVRRGQQTGVPIPILTALFDMLTAIEAGEKSMSRDNLNELVVAGLAGAPL